jgi:hypothetical protein
METITKSGLFYPNDLAHTTFLALEDIMGTNGLNAVLYYCGLSRLVNNFPPDNPACEFDFADFSTVIAAIEEMYGPRGSRILSLQVGSAIFNHIFLEIGDTVDAYDEEFQALDMREKIDLALSLLINTFSTSAKEVPVFEEREDDFLYSLESCPVCWGRKTETPSCFIFEGLLRATLRWISMRQEFDVKQISAHSCGDAACSFVVPKTPNP